MMTSMFPCTWKPGDIPIPTSAVTVDAEGDIYLKFNEGYHEIAVCLNVNQFLVLLRQCEIVRDGLIKTPPACRLFPDPCAVKVEIPGEETVIYTAADVQQSVGQITAADWNKQVVEMAAEYLEEVEPAGVYVPGEPESDMERDRR
jgi:hypothetical protein